MFGQRKQNISEKNDLNILVKNLSQLIRSGRTLCFFLGAGAAIDSSVEEKLRLPSGIQIRERILAHGNISPEEALVKLNQPPDTELTPDLTWQLIKDESYMTVSERLNFLGELFDYHLDNTGERQLRPIPSSYLNLARLVLAQETKIWIITTNFDEKLNEAFNGIRWKYKTGAKQGSILTAASTEQSKAIPLELPEKHVVIYKLHGTISEPTRIISDPRKHDSLSPQTLEKLEQVIRCYLSN